MKKCFINFSIFFCLILSGCSLSQKKITQYETKIEDLQNTINELKLQIDELQKQNQLLEESISRFSDYKVNIKDKYIISKNGNRVILNDYEYFEETENLISIKYILRKYENDKFEFYFFDKNGFQISRIQLSDLYEYPAITISSDEKYFVLDDGTGVFRTIEFYKFFETEKIKTFHSISDSFFYEGYFYFTLPSTEKVPGYCLNERDMYYSVVRYNPEKEVIEEILPYDSLNRYQIESFSNNTIEVTHQFVKKIEDWEGWECIINEKQLKVIIEKDNSYTIE